MTPIDPKARPDENSGTSYKRIVKSSALTGGSTAIDVILRIGRVKVLAVLLGPHGVGLIGLYTAIVQMVTALAILGVETSGVREIANARANGDAARVSELSRAVRAVLCVSGSIATLLLLVFAEEVSMVTFGTTDYARAVWVISVSVLLGTLLGSFRAELQGARRIGDLALVNVLGSVLGTLAAVGMVWFWREDAVAPLITVTAALSAGVAWWIARRVPIARTIRDLRRVASDSAVLLRLGFAFLFSAVAGNAIAYFTRALITRTLGTEYTGYYQAAAALAVLYIGFIVQAMGTDYFPRLSQARAPADCNRLVNEQTEVGLLLALPGVLGTLTFAPLVISIFYSAEFFPSVEVLRWQVLGVFLQVLTWPMGYILPSRGRSRLFLYTEILAVSIHASLIWIAVNTWGLVGAGIGYFLYYVAYGVMIFAVVRRETKFGFSARNLRLMLLAVPSIGLVYISQIYLSRPWAITFGSLATIIYGLYMMSALKGLLGIRDRIVGRVFERVGDFFRRGRRPRSRD